MQERISAEEFRRAGGAKGAAKAPFAPQRAPKGHHALGRLPPCVQNKTEQRYEDEVLKPALERGDVLWYAFEGVKLRLAPATFLTVDYFVMCADRSLMAIDVKGAAAIIEEDARVKLKVAASLYPFAFRMVMPGRGKDRGAWIVEEVGR